MAILKMEQHPLVQGAKAQFEAGHMSREGGYIKPAKAMLLDLVVTKEALDHALSFVNQLFMALERRGHQVVLASNGHSMGRGEVDPREKPSKSPVQNDFWRPMRSTVVYIGTVPIGLTVMELSEEVLMRHVKGAYVRETEFAAMTQKKPSLDYTWTTTKDIPSGRLCLQTYSSYFDAKWL